MGPSTFELLWGAHAERLLAFFVRRTLDAEASMDLVAETFAAAFVGRRRFRGSTAEDEAAFLYGIARRQLAHWYRHAAVRRRASARLGLEREVLDDESYARIEELARTQSGARHDRGIAVSEIAALDRLGEQLATALRRELPAVRRRRRALLVAAVLSRCT